MGKVSDWTKQNVVNAKKYAGFIPFAKISIIEGDKALPKAVLCHADVFAIYRNVLQYGKVS
jgi:archaellum biogenesis ATPase FlaH